MAQGASTDLNLILFTSDGLRWQDLFHGIDPKLMNEKAAHMHDAQALRDRFWRDDERQRREALMPFFWKTIAPASKVSDNVLVTNAYKVSYPGYSELLTGRTQDDVIRNNDLKQNPTESLLEKFRKQKGLRPEQVAVFSSWEAFRWIAEATPGDIFINAGYQDSTATPRIAELSKRQWQIVTPETSSRHDWFTAEMALNYMAEKKPRILYVALGETDEWAHAGRYDRYLLMMQYVDQTLQRLWEAAHRIPQYRNKTVFVMTADHGRGDDVVTWRSHGAKIAGAERIWAAIHAPGGAAFTMPERQCDILPSVLPLLG